MINPKLNIEDAKKYTSNISQVNPAATANYNEKRSQVRLLP